MWHYCSVGPRARSRINPPEFLNCSTFAKLSDEENFVFIRASVTTFRIPHCWQTSSAQIQAIGNPLRNPPAGKRLRTSTRGPRPRDLKVHESSHLFLKSTDHSDRHVTKPFRPDVRFAPQRLCEFSARAQDSEWTLTMLSIILPDGTLVAMSYDI
jgi:hypothetical protein